MLPDACSVDDVLQLLQLLFAVAMDNTMQNTVAGERIFHISV